MHECFLGKGGGGLSLFYASSFHPQILSLIEGIRTDLFSQKGVIDLSKIVVEECLRAVVR